MVLVNYSLFRVIICIETLANYIYINNYLIIAVEFAILFLTPVDVTILDITYG
jgi:hypothetical protein